jgi:hypothetical protein
MLKSVGCDNVFGSTSKWISTADRLDKNEGSSRFVSPNTAISLNTAIKMCYCLEEIWRCSLI